MVEGSHDCANESDEEERDNRGDVEGLGEQALVDCVVLADELDASDRQRVLFGLKGGSPLVEQGGGGGGDALVGEEREGESLPLPREGLPVELETELEDGAFDEHDLERTLEHEEEEEHDEEDLGAWEALVEAAGDEDFD